MKSGGRNSCFSLAVIIVIVAIVSLSVGIIAGYFIGKDKFETETKPPKCANPPGMARSDKEKREFYTNVINEMKADNIRDNLK